MRKFKTKLARGVRTRTSAGSGRRLVAAGSRWECYAPDMSDERGRRPPTREDLEALPEKVKGEIVDGELFTQPRPRARHGRAIVFLAHHLGGEFDFDDGGPGGWVILTEPGIELPDAPEIAPDLAGWRAERFTWPDDAPIQLVPDWVCEVLSPSNARWDQRKKFPYYARVGVPWLWVVNPAEQTVEIRRLEKGGWTVVAKFHGDDRMRAEPFDAVEIPLRKMWAPAPLPTR
jgi:Uma2 family endonuclease